MSGHLATVCNVAGAVQYFIEQPQRAHARNGDGNPYSATAYWPVQSQRTRSVTTTRRLSANPPGISS